MNDRLYYPRAAASYPVSGMRGYLWIAGGLAVTAAFAVAIDIPVARFVSDWVIFREIYAGPQIVRVIRGIGFGVFLAAALILLLCPLKRQFVPRVLLCALWSGLLAQGLKLLVARIRPGKIPAEFELSGSSTWQGIWTGVGGEWNVEYATQSFPSGHTATAVGLAIGLAWLFPRGRSALFSGLALMAAWQRIDSNAHWLSDVLAGAAVRCFGGRSDRPELGIRQMVEATRERRITNRRILAGQLVLADPDPVPEPAMPAPEIERRSRRSA